METAESGDAVCPFVCGICSSKFDKVAKFYAHLKTHKNFESLTTPEKKKDEMLEALNVVSKVDENVFRCGVCRVDFPSMSLLHDHMVCEENISSYNYCEKDHTARPQDSSGRTEQDRSEKSAEQVVKRGRGRPRKNIPKLSEDLSTTNDNKQGTDGSWKSARNQVEENSQTEASGGYAKTSGRNLESKEATVRSTRGKKKDTTEVISTVVITSGDDETSDKDGEEDTMVIPQNKRSKQQKSKTSNQAVNIRKTISPKKKMRLEEETPSPVRASSRRKVNRVDYKALAGFKDVVIKVEPEDPVYNNDDVDTTNDSSADAVHSSEEVGVMERDSFLMASSIKPDGSEESPKLITQPNEEVVVLAEGNDRVDDDDGEDEHVDDDVGDDDRDEDYLVDDDGAGSDEDEEQAEFTAEQKRHGGIRQFQNPVFSCTVCGKVLTRGALQKHKHHHHQEVVSFKHQCGECLKDFKTKMQLSHHMKVVHNREMYGCPKCNRVFRTKHSLNMHLGMHILKKELDAKAVDEVEFLVIPYDPNSKSVIVEGDNDTGKDEQQKNNAEAKSDDAMEEEEDSGGVAFDKVEMNNLCRKNMVVIDREEEFQETFKNYRAGRLCVRLGNSKTDERVQCTICKKAFKHKLSFKRHVRKIHLSDRMMCALCGEVFRFMKTFTIHIRGHVAKGELKYYGEKEKMEIEMDELAENEENAEETGEGISDLEGEGAEGREPADTMLGQDKTAHKADDKTQGADSTAQDPDDTSLDQIERNYAKPRDKQPQDEDVEDPVRPDTGYIKLAVKTSISDEEGDREAKDTSDNTFSAEAKVVKVKKASSRWMCDMCSFESKSEVALIKHKLIHSKEHVNRICQTCKLMFEAEEGLEKHLQTAHKSELYTCTVCGDRQRSRAAMYSHKAKHLMKTDHYYSEEVVQQLQEEEEKESELKEAGNPLGEKLVPCDICFKQVRLKRLRRHKEIHVETCNYKCEQCGKSYKSQRYLKDHIKKTHEKPRDATCEICGNTYKGKRYLEIHMQTHGDRDKICPHCGKGFTTQLYLKTHLQTHLEKKSFRCDKCFVGFSQRARLMIHMAEVHGKGQLKSCKYCHMQFPSRQKARIHERKAHEGYKAKKRIKNRGRKFGMVDTTSMGYYIVDNQRDQNNMIVRYINKDGKVLSEREGAVIEGAADDSGSPRYTVVEDEGAEVQVLELEQEGGASNNIVIQAPDGSSQVVETVDGSGLAEMISGLESGSSQDGAGETSAGSVEEQVVEMEIPEDTQQCQIILYPDGSFKLLNVLDTVTS